MITTGTSDGPYSTPGPLLLTYLAHKCQRKASQECGQNLLKPHYSRTSTATSSQQPPLYISGLTIQWNPTLRPSRYYNPILFTQMLESRSNFIINLKTPLTLPPCYYDQDFTANSCFINRVPLYIVLSLV